MPNLDLKSKDKNTILAALFMTLYALLRIVEFICIVTKWSLWSFLGLTDLLFVCEMISILFLAAIILISGNKKAMIFASLVAALFSVIYIIINGLHIINFAVAKLDIIDNVVVILAYVVFAVIVDMCKTNNSIGKTIWFIPSIFMLIPFALNIKHFLDINLNQIFGIDFNRFYAIYVISFVSGSVAFFFAGKKLSQEIVVTEKPSIGSVPKTDPLANKYMQTGNADKLLELKKMLDEGFITEEDFEAKKKQILNI